MKHERICPSTHTTKTCSPIWFSILCGRECSQSKCIFIASTHLNKWEQPCLFLNIKGFCDIFIGRDRSNGLSETSQVFDEQCWVSEGISTRSKQRLRYRHALVWSKSQWSAENTHPVPLLLLKLVGWYGRRPSVKSVDNRRKILKYWYPKDWCADRAKTAVTILSCLSLIPSSRISEP